MTCRMYCSCSCMSSKLNSTDWEIAKSLRFICIIDKWDIWICPAYIHNTMIQRTAHSANASSFSPHAHNIVALQKCIFIRERNFMRARERYIQYTYYIHMRYAILYMLREHLMCRKKAAKIYCRVHITLRSFCWLLEIHHEPNGTFHVKMANALTTCLRGKFQIGNAQKCPYLCLACELLVYMAPHRRCSSSPSYFVAGAAIE